MSSFKFAADIFSEIEQTTSRKIIEDYILRLIYHYNSVESAIILYILTGTLAPPFVQSVFGISSQTMLNLFNEQFGKKHVTALFQQYGDIGDVAFALYSHTKSQLELYNIYSTLWKITQITGKDAITRKQRVIYQLLSQLSNREIKYIVRLLVGKLRLGCSERTILSALKRRYQISTQKMDISYGVNPDIGYIAYLLKEYGSKGLQKVQAQIGIPVGAQLVERAQKAEDIYNRYHPVYLQPKFDGLRCQIHIWTNNTSLSKTVDKGQIWRTFVNNNTQLIPTGARVKLFSRNLNNITSMFPDITNESAKIQQNVILDAELIAEKNGKFLPFQDTIKRRRKYNIQSATQDLPIIAYVFDILYWKDKSLLTLPLKQRLKTLSKILSKDYLTKIKMVNTVTADSIKDIRLYFNKCINDGLEGIIAKKIDGTYRPSLRRFDWIKLKKSTNKNFKDTLDTIVLGYYYGTGKRTKFGIGSLLLGIYNSQTDKFVTIAKVGTKIKDEQWKTIKSLCDKYKTNQVPNNVIIPKELKPDVLIIPQIVCVVEADEITKSPIHSSGYSLRFPRLIEFDRKDKGPFDITYIRELTKSTKFELMS